MECTFGCGIITVPLALTIHHYYGIWPWAWVWNYLTAASPAVYLLLAIPVFLIVAQCAELPTYKNGPAYAARQRRNASR